MRRCRRSPGAAGRMEKPTCEDGRAARGHAHAKTHHRTSALLLEDEDERATN
jgi:hypothetical protein